MSHYDILDKIIQDLDPDDVRPEFIAAASIIDYEGYETVLTGDDLAYFLRHKDFSDIAEARVMLDVRRLRRAMIQEIDYFYDRVADCLENRD